MSVTSYFWLDALQQTIFDAIHGLINSGKSEDGFRHGALRNQFPRNASPLTTVRSLRSIEDSQPVSARQQAVIEAFLTCFERIYKDHPDTNPDHYTYQELWNETLKLQHVFSSATHPHCAFFDRQQTNGYYDFCDGALSYMSLSIKFSSREEKRITPRLWDPVYHDHFRTARERELRGQAKKADEEQETPTANATRSVNAGTQTEMDARQRKSRTEIVQGTKRKRDEIN